MLGVEFIPILQVIAFFAIRGFIRGGKTRQKQDFWRMQWESFKRRLAGDCPDELSIPESELRFLPVEVTLHLDDRRDRWAAEAWFDARNVLPHQLGLRVDPVPAKTKKLLYGPTAATGDEAFDRTFVLQGEWHPEMLAMLHEDNRRRMVRWWGALHVQIEDGYVGLISTPDASGTDDRPLDEVIPSLARQVRELATDPWSYAERLFFMALTDPAPMIRRYSRRMLADHYVTTRFGRVLAATGLSTYERMSLLRIHLEQEDPPRDRWARAVEAGGVDEATRAWIRERVRDEDGGQYRDAA